MSILKILQIPDERLRKIAVPVKKFNLENVHIINDMFDTMYAKSGIGLAATQVNIHRRIIVLDISENHTNPLVLINPELLDNSGNIKIEEGCLSIPGQKVFVPRAEKIKIRALDYNGNIFQLKAGGLLAVCIQHEMDHLIGKLLIDYLSPLKKERIIKKIKKLQHYCL